MVKPLLSEKQPEIVSEGSLPSDTERLYDDLLQDGLSPEELNALASMHEADLRDRAEAIEGLVDKESPEPEFDANGVMIMPDEDLGDEYGGGGTGTRA